MTYGFAGARGRIGDPEAVLRKAHAWATAHGSEVLLADARAVFGRDHVESAVRHAIRARDAKTIVARTLAIEVLRYLSGEGQVSDAIRLAGIRRGTNHIAIVILGDGSVDVLVADMGWSRDDEVLAARGKRLAALGITDVEAGTVSEGRREDLALERVALLDVTK